MTQTDSVTLNCQTPSSVSVTQCYFMTLSGGTVRSFPCVKTLTGTELLLMAQQSSPAEVKMKCYYTAGQGRSSQSDTSYIIINSPPPPRMTVNPPVITEIDSVTLNCQTPSPFSVTQCFFMTLRGGTARPFPCLKTLAGTELLLMAHQSSPAEVKVKCFYTVKLGVLNSTSSFSEPSSIIINSPPPPRLTVNPPVITETDSVTLNCQTPSSVSVDQCYFTFLSGGSVRSLSCLKTLTGTELLLLDHQSSPAEVKVKCYYTMTQGRSSQSDTSSITLQNQRLLLPSTDIAALLPPKLTISSPVMTQTDSVTLICQTPSSVSVIQCYFITLSGGTVRSFPCVKTLTGTELLLMAQQSSPAEVKVKCYYTVKQGRSSQSDTSYIIINSPPPPRLTVNPPVITEIDSVTLNCQTPSPFSVTQCFFMTLRGGTARPFPCLKTLTGTELLLMAHQSSPAEVKVKCFYTVKLGVLNSTSSFSEPSSIIIHSPPPPRLTVNPPVITETDSVTLNCQTPSSVSVDQCLFMMLSGRTVRSFPCLKTLTGTELLLLDHQSSPAEVKVKCYYTMTQGRSSQSDTSSITLQNQRLLLPSTDIAALLPPKLTVSSPVMTQTDSVTLICQTPSSVSVIQCYFITLRGGTVRSFPCVKTLTGTELLLMAQQSSPAEVKIKCYYTVKQGRSSESETFSIIINSPPPPRMTVNPPVITEIDSVTLNCQTPSPFSVTQCFFMMLSGGTARPFPCLKTLAGTELLLMAHQSSPAEVKVKCFYTVKLGVLNSTSSFSEPSSIIIHSPPPPRLTVNPPVITETDSVTLNCQTPSSVSVDQCHFTFLNGGTVRSFPCLKTLTGTELLLLDHQSSPAEVKVKCFYTMTQGRSSQSDTSSITLQNQRLLLPSTDIADTGKLNLDVIRTSPTFTVTTETDTGITPTNPEFRDKIKAATWMQKLVIAVSGCGVTAGIIFLVLAVVRTQRTAGSEEVKRCENGAEKDSQNLNSDIYHLYAIISDEPAASVQNVLYQTVQVH
ncbi:uncharacterized protein LOC113154446 [Anabas testudineus]|uniref:uncharacterized protein LOC113154446 n=1 Tax=Anabas testudineus TaxID=64144 RepID=UPI000E45C117|nr:uncharacterized protein LOC113154446 [Anabas testudineus]